MSKSGTPKRENSIASEMESKGKGMKHRVDSKRGRGIDRKREGGIIGLEMGGKRSALIFLICSLLIPLAGAMECSSMMPETHHSGMPVPASSIPCPDCASSQMPISHILTCCPGTPSLLVPSFETTKTFYPALMYSLPVFVDSSAEWHLANPAGYQLKLPIPVPLYLLLLSFIS